MTLCSIYARYSSDLQSEASIEDQVRLCRDFLKGFEEHVSEACVGSISEVFDADSPYTPRGCVAQAWSVAEVLRCWARTAKEP